MSDPPSERRSTLRFAVVIAIGTLVLLELGLRVFSRSDVDGNVWVGPLRVLPYRVPVEDVRARIAEYLDSRKSFLKYDPDLGWTIRPNASSSDGLYHSNADGVRTGADRVRAPLEPRPGVLRVAVFGDSFAFGADVGFEEAWPTVVGARLREGGRAVEVLNYGVGGYAIDQAYLRYRKQGRRYAPDIVVFAFQPSDVKRNLNLFRPFYSPRTGIVFTKPRFVLDPEAGGGPLVLVNERTVAPRKLAALLEQWDEWTFKDREFFYRDRDYAESPLYASRLAAFVATGLRTSFSSRRLDVDFFAPEAEARLLTLAILERFRADVEMAGSRFLIVHVPNRRPLGWLVRKEAVRYAGLLDLLRERFEVLDPAPALVERARDETGAGLDDLFGRGSSHYSPRGNRIVAESVVFAIRYREVERLAAGGAAVTAAPASTASRPHPADR